MALVRPRLNDFHGLAFTQEEAEFAIPFLDDDIPLYVDPFLLWKSPSLQDQALHTALVSSLNHLGYLAKSGKESEAVEALIRISECQEAGLGSARDKRGKRIGEGTARAILSLFSAIPQVKLGGFEHIEEIQLFVDQIGKDRISDLTCSLTKSFLIDFTIDQCAKRGIPGKEVTLDGVFDYAALYGSRQLVFELKNVREIEREHVNQLNRYLSDEFGRFGVLITRNPMPKHILKNTIDLWSGQRRCIIALTDADLEMMVTVFESRQRLPIEVLKRAYVDFTRACPS
jgi:hypothetical protein